MPGEVATPQEREAFYDEEVAPVLLEIAYKCDAKGLSFVASVEWSHDGTGETVLLHQDAGIKSRLAALAVRAHGNVDSLIFALLEYGKKHGHNSLFLSLIERVKDVE